ncbi:MAG: hypothetical protein F4X51_18735 [Gemmatimonadetes bacterium]|nr:hypothetical protein [Gemmatimonadota bacterium]
MLVTLCDFCGILLNARLQSLKHLLLSGFVTRHAVFVVLVVLFNQFFNRCQLLALPNSFALLFIKTAINPLICLG